MGDKIQAVEYTAEVRQVKTMADHTVNVTLNLPEYCKTQAAWFMQHQGDMVQSVSIVMVNDKTENDRKEQTEQNY